MYIKDDVNFDELHVDGDIESVWIKITHEKTPVIVGMKYRPPSATVPHLGLCILCAITGAPTSRGPPQNQIIVYISFMVTGLGI